MEKALIEQVNNGFIIKSKDGVRVCHSFEEMVIYLKEAFYVITSHEANGEVRNIRGSRK